MPFYGCASGVRSTADGGTSPSHPTPGILGSWPLDRGQAIAAGERGPAKCGGSDKDRKLRIVEQSAVKQFGQVLHTPGLPLRRQDLSLGAPSNRRRRPTSTQLQSHLVPYAGRRMENQKLTAAAVPLPNRRCCLPVVGGRARHALWPPCSCPNRAADPSSFQKPGASPVASSS
jgi:hypothetical protein